MLTVKFETKRDGRSLSKTVMECTSVHSYVNKHGATIVNVDLPDDTSVTYGDGPQRPNSATDYFYVMNEAGQTIDGGCMTSTMPQVVPENEENAA